MKQANVDLLKKIVAFAEKQDDILFLGLIGSSSNEENLNDEFSDIDLILVTDSLTNYYNNDAWLSSIDDVWMTFTESAADINYWERRCVFKNGLDADFVIVEKSKVINSDCTFPVLNDICRKTLQEVLDKGNYYEFFKRFMNAQKQNYIEPTQEEYSNVVNDFYFHYLWAYKKCLRGEYWIALQCVNYYLKNKTLSIIEWYEHAVHGNSYNTFYQGRFIEKWIEEPIKKEMKQIYSSYGKENILNALDANMVLFTRLAKEISALKNFTFPEQKVAMLTEWIQTTYRQK